MSNSDDLWDNVTQTYSGMVTLLVVILESSKEAQDNPVLGLAPVKGSLIYALRHPKLPDYFHNVFIYV